MFLNLIKICGGEDALGEIDSLASPWKGSDTRGTTVDSGMNMQAE